MSKTWVKAVFAIEQAQEKIDPKGTRKAPRAPKLHVYKFYKSQRVTLQFWLTFGSSNSHLIQCGKCLLRTWRYFFFFFCYIINVLYCCQITHTISKCQSIFKSKDSAMWKWAPSSVIICSGLLLLRFLSTSREAVFVVLFYPTWHLQWISLFFCFQEVSQEEGWRN